MIMNSFANSYLPEASVIAARRTKFSLHMTNFTITLIKKYYAFLIFRFEHSKKLDNYFADNFNNVKPKDWCFVLD